MSPIRKLLLVCVGAFALHSVQACSTDTELNPQPLPPQGGGGDTTRAPSDVGNDKNAEPNGGASAPPPAAAKDAGADADGGGDAGDG